MRWRKDKRPGLPPAIEPDLELDSDPDLEPDTELDTDPAVGMESETDGTVVDLAAARTRRTGDANGRPDTNPDTGPDGDAEMSDRDPDSGPDNDSDDRAETDPDGDGPVLVDSVEAQSGEVGPPRWHRPGLPGGEERRPILPPWLTSRTEFGAAARWLVGHIGHTLAYHAVRVPKYMLRLLFRAPRGAFRVVRGWSHWLFDLSGEPVRQAAVRREDAKEYLALTRVHDKHVRWRGIVTTAAAILVIPAIIVAAWWAPEWARWTALAVAVAGLGLLGRPADKPLLDTAVVRPRVSKLTSAVVVRALSVLSVAGINDALRKNPKDAIAFTAPITRDGPGWRADIDLPPGVTAAEVIDRRDKLAAGLSRPLGCVWPEGNHEVHPGRLVLWVGDQDMAKAAQQPWPLLKSGTVDLFKPQPFGTDQRGRWVTITLMFASMAVGSIPRMGKTFTVRELLLIAALDPRAEVHAFDLKGTGDLSALEPVCHRYRAGDEPDDIEYGLATMREWAAELSRRAKVIRNLPKDVCPENKVTPELASNPRYGLHPIVGGVDECQRWFEHPVHGKELEAICTDVVKRGPALGMTLILATQRPDANSLPTAIGSNLVLRFCLKVMGQLENDMVLGTSSYKNGVRATMFSRRDLGIGYLAGEGDDPRIVRTVYLDALTAEQIVRRARAARERAGRITGHALGEQPATEAARTSALLDDILTVCPPGEGSGKFWTETVLDRLATHNPGTYGEMSRDQLVAALRAQGVTTRQVWGTGPDGAGANRRGIDTDQVNQIVAERNRRKGAAS